MGIETATIVVADVVSSTAQRIPVGEERADALRRDIDEALGVAVSTGGGPVVKYLGDGVLTLSRSASGVVAAAVEMQRAVWRLGPGTANGPALRVGLSPGDVSLEGGDCFGTPVVEWLQDAVCQWILRLAASGPVVVVVDDLHWADDVTVRVFRAVARGGRPAGARRGHLPGYRPRPVASLHRGSAGDPPRGRAVTDLARRPGRRGRVRRARPHGGSRGPEAFTELVTDQCDGNPFFIRETILHLAEEEGGRVVGQA